MNEEIKKLIDFYGSRSRLARALGVHRAAVTQWCDQGGLPPKRAIQVEQLTGGMFKAVDICVRDNDEK